MWLAVSRVKLKQVISSLINDNPVLSTWNVQNNNLHVKFSGLITKRGRESLDKTPLYIKELAFQDSRREDTLHLIARNDPTEADIKMKSFLLWIGVFTFLLTTCLAYREVSLTSDLKCSLFYKNIFLVHKCDCFLGQSIHWRAINLMTDWSYERI